MLKLTRPKNGNKNLFYVSSESKADSVEATHIVVKIGTLVFCDCRDFMTRRLPIIGTSKYSPCKHGKFVNESIVHANDLNLDVVLAIQNEGRSIIGAMHRTAQAQIKNVVKPR